MYEVEDGEFEILARTAEIGPARFYAIYKNVKLPLSTAWRRAQKLIREGYLNKTEKELIDVTDKGLLVLACRGHSVGLVRLAKSMELSVEEAASMAEFICRNVKLSGILLTSIWDIVRVIPLPRFAELKGTNTEGAAAKVLLKAYPAIELDGVGTYLIDHGVVVAASCSLCGQRHELFPNCHLWEKAMYELRTIFIRAANSPHIYLNQKKQS
ncbi:MAG: hypothetical protein ABWJ97_00905 [Thermoproteus sp.]